MKRPWLKLLLFLIPAVAGTIYCLWRFSPEQAIIRRADALFETIEKKTIELGDGPAENAVKFQSFLSPKFEVTAPSPVPTGPISPAIAASRLEEFQSVITSCKIVRDKDTVAFPGKGAALLQSEVQVDVTVGRSTRRVLRYRARLEYEKVGRDWLLTKVVLTPF